MTCIVGIQKEGRVYLGADRAASNGWTVVDSGVSKVFKNGKMIAGYSGSFRFGQLLEYVFEVPPQPKDVDDMKYMCLTFVDALREVLKDRGQARIRDNVESTGWGSALIGYRGVLYELDSDFQVRPKPYASTGSGYIAALGVLNHLHRTAPKMNPNKMLEHALTTAADLTGSVSGPFNFVKSRKVS